MSKLFISTLFLGLTILATTPTYAFPIYDNTHTLLAKGGGGGRGGFGGGRGSRSVSHSSSKVERTIHTPAAAPASGHAKNDDDDEK